MFTINNAELQLRVQDNYSVPDNNPKWVNVTNLLTEAKNGRAELKNWKESLQNSCVLIKEHIDNFTKTLLETHKETFNLEANKQTFKTYIFKSKSNNLTIQDLQKGLNTPNKILNIRQELGIDK